ncbi:uncharacterized protein PHACADRAFT_246750 [Phanerochaete carnosa HHB-10118-sp]|uniref:Uncharacterized protein n=1 Tax=Phanerochaete carnosa (strain HHB-10118-sp) TaxID=650164 RepID=K5XCG3_PHACS|nr:uncharacterized protein PHACADRAFT_246750 [Phanerochaete carnosa HHB-10118-sp]EKM60682.1 hypothetical protein PHACADRAFT_246750 [Phanerochaete carnosa HHB-10118-sp]
MYFLTAVLPLFAALAPVFSAPLTESPFMGTIATPASNTPLSANTAFPFGYNVDNWCEEGYNNFKVFLTETAPTIDDVDSTGDIQNALYSFGQFTVANFGLPPSGTPPPSSLVVPDIGAEGPGFLAVVQIFTSCPGDVTQEIGIASVLVSMQ